MEDRQREPVILFILPAICYLFGNFHKSSWSSGTYGTFLILVITVISSQKRGLNWNFLTLALYLLETEIAFDGVGGAVHCGILSSISGLYPLDGTSTRLPTPNPG